MVEIKAKLKIARAAYKVEVKGQLRLPFGSRSGGRLHATLVSGEEVALALPRGEVLRGGDLVTASDGRVFEVIAASESLLHAQCANAAELAKAAYLLGSRHVPVQVGDGFLRLAAGHGLEETLNRLGAKVTHVDAPFEPEAGAHGGGHQGGHAHVHDEERSHDHGHDHDHDHDHAHARGHGHTHAHEHNDADEHAKGHAPDRDHAQRRKPHKH